MSNQRASAVLAERALSSSFGDEARRVAARATLDTIGSMAAGLRAPEVRPVLSYARAVAPPGDVVTLGLDDPTMPTAAAFVGGVLAHALDYDDVSHSVKGHPSAVLVPTLLALGQYDSARSELVHHARPTGPELLDAYLAGFDASVALAAGVDGPEHYRRGWHATSTLGVVGAAAAGARLLGLDRRLAGHAIGIAASFAAGMKQNFGSTTKPLHVGRAAEGAVTAVLLSAAGATADPASLDGPQGFFALYGAGFDAAAFGEAVARTEIVLGPGGINVKKYPCCYNAHRAIDAALATYHRHHGAGVRAARVCVERNGSGALIHHDPTTGLEAKFCGEYVVAAALLQGSIGLADFTDEAVKRLDVRQLMPAVSFSEASTPPFGDEAWTYGFATIEVDLNDGRTLRERVDVPRGDARNPLTDDELRQKFGDCAAAGGLSDDSARALADEVFGLTEARSLEGLTREVAR